MKKLFSLLFFLMTIALTVVADNDLNTKQTRMRDDIFNFLKCEGFVPNIDSNGNIQFKSQGVLHRIRIYSSDVDPMYLSMYVEYTYADEKFTQYAMRRVAADVSTFKAVRLELYDDSYHYTSDLYLTSAEAFNTVFYKLKKQIEALSNEVADKLSNY